MWEPIFGKDHAQIRSRRNYAAGIKRTFPPHYKYFTHLTEPSFASRQPRLHDRVLI
jgi:hypothetical protein